MNLTEREKELIVDGLQSRKYSFEESLEIWKKERNYQMEMYCNSRAACWRWIPSCRLRGPECMAELEALIKKVSEE